MNTIKRLPLQQELETREVLKKAIQSNKALANLNGIARIIPNQNILINSFAMQEAKDSSEIENIITTHDELHLANISNVFSKEEKEVQNYKNALLFGYNEVKRKKVILTNDIVEIQQLVVANNAGIRSQAGTNLKNQQTGETIYTPPQDKEEVLNLLSNLEKYINDNDLEDFDPLVKMAIIHFQFESIHPFYDGNGRAGRILNILYLVLNQLLDLPILYLSRYIIKNKSDYYRLLQEVREKNNWNEWILYMLDGVEQTATETISLIKGIQILMNEAKTKIQKELPNIYSKDLIEILFTHPYTKIEFLIDKLKITRQTSSKYLREIQKIGMLEEIKLGKSIGFRNIKLFELLKEHNK
jgi:Fic family protein